MSRVDVLTLDKAAQELLKAGGEEAKIDYANEGNISKKYMMPSMSAVGCAGKRNVGFVLEEYEQVVEADGIVTEGAYCAASTFRDCGLARP